MDNEIGITGERTEAGEMTVGVTDPHDTHLESKDFDESEVFEDAITDSDSFYTPQHLDESGLKNPFSTVSEGNSDDLRHVTGRIPDSFKVEDLNPEKTELVTSEPISSFQANSVSSEPIETTAAEEAAVCSVPELEDDSGSSSSTLHADECNGDAEEFKVNTGTGDVSSLSQSLIEQHDVDVITENRKKQVAADSYERADVTDISGHTSIVDNKKVIRGINCNGDGLNYSFLETTFVPEDGNIVSEFANEDLGGVKSENGIINDETSFDKAGDIDGIEPMDDIFMNKYEVQEMRTEGNDDAKESGMIAEADASLKEEEVTYPIVTSENADLLIQNGGDDPVSPIISKVVQETLKDSISVEDSCELSSRDFDEDNTLKQQAPSFQSQSATSASPSLPFRPTGLGSRGPLLDSSPASFHSSRPNGSISEPQARISEDLAADDADESDEIREKLQMIRVKFLRLAHRLGQTPHNVVVAQVLYRLGLAEQLRGNTNRSGVFSYDRASVMAEQLEAAGQDPLDFSCTIMVLGKTGVGKSATINSIYGDAKLCTDAFQSATKKVQNVIGTVHGIKLKVIDTPGLSSCSSDHQHNERILNSIKRFIGKTPPDIVLYFDRLDMQARDYGDVPLLRTITDVFGASIWFNAIVVLTHAASAPPDGPNGSPLSYEMFVTQRSHVIQQAIRQAAGDVRLMNPVSLVENHSACRMNRAGQRVLPNGQVWKPQLLLLSFASKILHEANMLLKLVDSPANKPFESRPRIPPLPFFLSSLLQSRPQLKLPDEEIDDEDSMFDISAEISESDVGSDYEELPPFKCLTRSQLSKLSKAQKKAYFEELDYREKLFFKKQLKEEKDRRRLSKKMAESVRDDLDDRHCENIEDDSGGPASVPVPMPDLVLPNSFDSDYPTHRYRFLDSSNKWLVRPVLESQGWDHDVGYEGLNVERLFVVKNKVPFSISGQLTKDKRDCTLQMEAATLIKHREGMASSVGLDLQTVGKDMVYTLHGETKIKNFRCNNTAAGLSVTMMGDSVSAGAKIEDKIVINKRLRMLLIGGAMAGHGDVAFGGRLEAAIKDGEYPTARHHSTIALSIVDWHGDLAVGCNFQSQHPLGRGTNAIFHGNLSNKGSGQIGVRLNSSDQLQIALLALLPIFRSLIRMISTSSGST